MAITDRCYAERDLIYVDEETTASQAVKLINQFSISKVVLENRPKSNKGISFLTECPTVTSLLFYPTTIEEEDLEPLYAMPSLKDITISNYNVEIDFTRMKKLESAYLLWSSKIQSIFKVKKLKSLDINWIKSAKVVDLSFLGELKNLEKFRINSAKIQSLNGLKALKNLKDLKLDRLPKLTDISDLGELNKLKQLYLRGSKSAINLEKTLGKLTHLKELILSEQKEIKSLAFVRRLKELKHITFDRLTVLDGDLTPLLDKKLTLEHAVFNNRKHYTHTFDEIYDILHGIKSL